MNRTAAHIRPYRPGDLDALYQICLLTGDNGQDATSLFADPMLLGHFFAAPYGLFAPSLAFVLEDAQGVGGYILGALDTRAFEEQLESNWWPRLRTRYPDPAAGVPAEQWTRDQRLAHSGRAGVPLPVAPAHRHAAALAGRRIRPSADQHPHHGPARPRVPGGAPARSPRQPARGRVLPAPRLHRTPCHRCRTPST